MLSFYSSILPLHPAYDFVHYRNYFLITTLIIIILQDLNFYRIKQSEKANKNVLNSVSLKQFKSNKENVYTDLDDKNKKFVFTDNAFETDNKNLELNQDDELFFDVRHYKNKTTINENAINAKSSDHIEEMSIENDFKENKWSRIEVFYSHNQNFLIIAFVIVLIMQFAISTYVMISSTSRSIYQFVTFFVHPIIILTSKILNHYNVNVMKN